MKPWIIFTVLLVLYGLYAVTAFHLPTRGPLILWRPPGKQSINRYIATFGLGDRFPEYKKKVINLKELIAKFFKLKINKEKLSVLFDDIILSESQVDRLTRIYTARLRSGGRTKRKILDFTFPSNQKWDVSKPIKYILAVLSEKLSRAITDAIKHWEDNTCIRFQQIPGTTRLTPKENHLVFLSNNSCASFLGINPGSDELEQPVYVGINCIPLVGVAIHEIGHALGFVHEQTRLDRDSFVKIDESNISPNTAEILINFQKNFIDSLTTLGVPYDVGSIMHYDRYVYSVNQVNPTIIANDPLQKLSLGQRSALSFYDIKIANLAYCKDKCRNKRNCQRGGITDPNNCNKCICPDGFGGNDCETVGSVHNGCTPSQQIITVTSGEQCLKSPNYGGSGAYAPLTECNWHLQAGNGEQIELYFKGTFSVYAYHVFSSLTLSCYHWVEVKHKKNLNLPGARFCGSFAPQQRLITSGSTAVVSFRSNVNQNEFENPIPATRRKGFQLCFKLASGQGGSPNTPGPPTPSPACSNKEILKCNNLNKWSITTTPNSIPNEMNKAIINCGGKFIVKQNIKFKIQLLNNPQFRVLKVCIKRSKAKGTTIVLKQPGIGIDKVFKLKKKESCKMMSVNAKELFIELEKKGKKMKISDLTVEVCKN